MEKKRGESGVFDRVYHVVRQVPPGRVATYGGVARLVGNPRLSRVVGYALNACPSDSEVPCHRVVNRFGELSDAFEPLGRDSHRLLLELEGVAFLPDGRVDLERHLWSGPAER